MSHDIEERNGTHAMAYNAQRGLPWHGLGTPLDGDATAKEMLIAADCDWTVTKQPVYARRSVLVEDGEFGHVEETYVQIEDTYETVRSDDLKTLGVVGSVYEDFSNGELLEFGQSILDQARETSHLPARWDTMMSLRGGKIVVANLVVPEAFTVLGDDAHDLNLGVFTSHDGSSALGADIGVVRRVCMNTHMAALGSAKSSVKIRHTATMNERIEQAAKVLGLTFDYTKAYADMAEELAKISMSTEEVDGYLKDLVPVTAKTEHGEKRTLELRQTIKANIQDSPTISDDLRLTRWGVLQSTVEWVDHLREMKKSSKVDRAEQVYLSSQPGGSGYKIKEAAYGLLTV